MTALFRSEVLNQKKDRLSGEVSIAVPMPWQVIGYLIFGSVVVALIFLSLASYSRVETVTGVVVPDRGVASIIPTRGGTISEIMVEDGDRVEAGTTLAAIRAEEDSASGLSAAAMTEQAIAQQDASLAAQLAASQRSAAAQRSQIAVQVAGLRSEIDQLRSQITLQENLVESAQANLDQAQSVAERGFISQVDLQRRQDELFSRQQQLAQLQQSLTSRRATLAEISTSSANIAAQAESQAASIAASRAQVAQQAAGNEGARSYALTAPITGTVTALTMRSGQRVNPQSQLMAIVPEGATLRAELNVPSQAIGFVKEGQEVRLAIDAFPYQRFGTVIGKVRTVATSALGQQVGNGAVISVYPVVVELEETQVTAFGREEMLVPGMTLTARIVTENQSLIEWLFEPLFAVQKR
ncbi:HlyD family efflux transporter periplasmic adaptor subunit [uncultured Erythrobacter sp.]|uniref:HlyD family efflux transporter periplasmic adaptor subunit n=1 Tax=uncultured Erythrobacter sp. TaxID=263913 RepID=UPI002617F3A7|nr:HlyD family efflux transporter periplasmic adaptor subunit [uncultured Erythrobacter sp.]